MIWKIGGNRMLLADMYVRAESFDEALAEARKIDPRYSSGQVVDPDQEGVEHERDYCDSDFVHFRESKEVVEE